MSKQIKELQRIRSILSYVTGFEDDDQENIEDARKSVDRVIDSLAEQPAQRTWVGLTDEEAFQICVDCGCLSEDWLTLLDAIEAKLRSKNENSI